MQQDKTRIGLWYIHSILYADIYCTSLLGTKLIDSTFYEVLIFIDQV